MKKAILAFLSALARSVRLFPLFWAAVAAVTGILLADQIEFAGMATVFILFLLSLFVGFRAPKLRIAVWALSLVGGTFFLLHHSAINAIHSFPLRAMVAEGKSVRAEVRGVIVSEPVFQATSATAILELRDIQRGEHVTISRHRVPIRFRQPANGLSYGDAIFASGTFSPLEPAQVPGGFDARRFYFREAGALARFEVGAGDLFELEGGFHGSRVLRFAIQSRNALDAALRAGLNSEDEPFARLIAAMAFGARENSPEDLEEWFRLSGTTHLFAVSGMHVGIVGMILLGVLLMIKIPRRHAVWIVIPLILFYAVLTGLRPSAMRAAVMMSAFLAAYGLREKPAPLNALGFAALLLLGFDTNELFLPGFQLSFTVLLFLLLFAASLGKLIQKPFRSDPFLPASLLTVSQRWSNQIVFVVASALAVSVTSWMGSSGWLTWHFQSLAPVGMIANLVMVPFAGLIISLAFLSTFFVGIKCLWLGGLFNQLNVGITVLLTTMAQFFAELPGANQNTGDWFERTGSLSGIASPPVQVDLLGRFGSESALLTIRTESGPTQYWLVDGGDESHYRSLLLPLLRSKGVNRLDAIILTHGDIKHIGALPRILRQFRPRLLIESPAENRSSVYPEIEQTAEKLGVRRTAVRSGKVIRIADTAEIRIHGPRSEKVGRIADDKALIFSLHALGSTVLFTSDTGFAAEKNLLERGIALQSDVWVRGQHSEAPSGLPAFIEAVQPRAVVSGNATFPPQEKVDSSLLDYLSSNHIPFYGLDEHGMITLLLGKEGLEVRPFRSGSFANPH